MLGNLQLECGDLHETLLVPVLMYGREKMSWKEERSRIRGVQMENCRGSLGIRRMDRVPNGWIKKLYRTKKGLDERTDEGVLQWFGHVERMDSDRIARRVYV